MDEQALTLTVRDINKLIVRGRPVVAQVHARRGVQQLRITAARTQQGIVQGRIFSGEWLAIVRAWAA